MDPFLTKLQETKAEYKDKDEKHDPKAAPTNIKEDEFAMTVEIPPGGRCANLEL